MKDQLHSPWGITRFLTYITPSVLSILIVSLYMVVDALFVSRYAGTLAMAAVSIIMPLFSLCFGVGIMMAAGSSAVIGIEIGEGKTETARRHFSLGFYFLVATGLLIILLTVVTGWDRLARLLGASDLLMADCTLYLRAFIVGIAAVLLQVYLEYSIRLDGEPIWSFYVTLAGGFTNVALDYLFIVKLGMGVEGAGIASTAGICVASSMGVFYFLTRGNVLGFTRPVMDWTFLKDSLLNGFSEMVTEFSSGAKTLIFNRMLLAYAGEAGVAAMSILTYLYFLFSSLYIGLSMGVSPLVSVSFGAKNVERLREFMGHSIKVTLVGSLVTYLLILGYGDAIITLFTAGRADVTGLAAEGMSIMSLTFLVIGFNILSSGIFTALNNGKISAVISFLRSFVFTIGFLVVLPPIMGTSGIWASITAAEVLTLFISVFFALKYRVHYLGKEAMAICN